MKNQLKQVRAKALAVAMTLAFGIFFLTAEVSVTAQGHAGHSGQTQSDDMPYDLHFIDMMMMHHQQGIEMAKLAEGKSQDARVKTFAAKTAAAQEKDIQTLQWHRDNHYAGRAKMDHRQMMTHMQNKPGHEGMKMDMEGDMGRLRAAMGREFDRLFLDTMSHHHLMAVGMSKEAATKAEHSEIKELARHAAQMQQAEIAEMNRIRAGSGGKAVRKTGGKSKNPAPKKPGHSGHTGH